VWNVYFRKYRSKSPTTQECNGCGRRVRSWRSRFVWTADSEGLCIECCQKKGLQPVRGDDGLLYA
jgi:hypothetical protein